jgi:hypothetical protein
MEEIMLSIRARSEMTNGDDEIKIILFMILTVT